MERKKHTKWDTLYDSEHRSLFSKIEESAINNYFSKIFTKAILSSTNLKSGKVFEPGSGGGMASARLASLGFELTCMDLSQNALRKSTSLFKSLSLDYFEKILHDMISGPNIDPEDSLKVLHSLINNAEVKR